jgi:hypothetical protein
VRKWAIASEVTALAVAQEVRPAARAIPELVASGRDGQGWWMITPFHAGRQAVPGAPPTVVFDSQARLHACFRAGRANLRACRSWITSGGSDCAGAGPRRWSSAVSTSTLLP